MGGSVNPPTPYGRRKNSRRKREPIHQILGMITDRDTEICLDLYEHKALTTHQLFELHFPSYHRARKRLLELHRRAVINRIRPPKRPGSNPFHYVLDDLGALLVAGYLGVELKALKFKRDRVARLARSPHLRHLRDTNSFFSRLVFTCRRAEDGTLLQEWLGELRAARAVYGLANPDGLGVLEARGEEVSFLLELDRGTEDWGRLQTKLDRYRQIERYPEVPHAVLLCFRSEAREVGARRLMGCAQFTVATTTLSRHLADPLGPVWLPWDDHRRVRLLELPRPQREPFDRSETVVPRDYDNEEWW
jgi:hypothetical protein